MLYIYVLYICRRRDTKNVNKYKKKRIGLDSEEKARARESEETLFWVLLMLCCFHYIYFCSSFRVKFVFFPLNLNSYIHTVAQRRRTRRNKMAKTNVNI